MADTKKYYWLKLNKDFFKRHDIRIIEDMENGKDYILFYMKLLLESIDHEGALRFSNTIPYNDKMLSTITNTNIDIVRSAVKIFKELEMMEILEDGTIYIQQVNKMLGFETEWAKKKREYRKTLPDKTETKKDNVRQEIDIDIELEKDKEKYINIYTAWNNNINTRTHDLKVINKFIQKKHKDILDLCTEKEILQAIENYGVVNAGDQYYFSYRWTLWDFIIRGLMKFVDDARPLENYLKSEGNEPEKIVIDYQEYE